MEEKTKFAVYGLVFIGLGVIRSRMLKRMHNELMEREYQRQIDIAFEDMIAHYHQ